MIEPSGIWTLRVGRFGAPDNMTRGGVVLVEGGRIFGGDSNLAYIGNCQADGTAISGHLHVIRHGDPTFVTIFGDTEPEYDLEFVGERLRPGYYEGRLFRRPDFEGRIVMRRLGDLAPFPCDMRDIATPALRPVPLMRLPRAIALGATYMRMPAPRTS